MVSITGIERQEARYRLGRLTKDDKFIEPVKWVASQPTVSDEEEIMANVDLRFRQIHLDFHTSELIEGIGADFDPDEFASTLEKARVDSITCFAKCHHGYLYYDTKELPERRHPHLTRNLLKDQIDACHKRNIRVPIYITVQWDKYTADTHPEWLVVSEAGAIRGTPPYEPGFYRAMCVNTAYVDTLKTVVQEVLETLPTDGLFFDIVMVQDCSCRRCIDGMIAKGLEPSHAADRKRYALDVLDNFMLDMTDFVRGFNKDCMIFYNSGHIAPRHRKVAHAFSHFELESLPSGHWGYAHFPLTMRYARTLGLDCLGMTGKFHTTWGDFHSFKNEAALQYECFRSIAMNAKCSVGDQLHPSGKICPDTYNLIGSVYSEVEKKEPWCKGVLPLNDIGVFTTEEFSGEVGPALKGVARMLHEGFHQFDIIDSTDDFSRYKVLILPDEIPISDGMAKKIRAYLKKSGALISSYQSGLDEGKNTFVMDEFGLRVKGDAPFSPDFIVPGEAVGKGLPATEHVMYQKGMEVEPRRGTEILAQVVLPYFNRTYRHFCSHNHTPSARKVGYPGITQKGKIIYFAHPIFRTYDNAAPRWCRTLFLNALELLLPEPLLRVEAPTTLFTTLNSQPAENRWVLHLLHYVPERRSQRIEIIEDVIPLFDVKVTVNAQREVKKITCVPNGKSLGFENVKGLTTFTVPRIGGHQMVEIAFG